MTTSAAENLLGLWSAPTLGQDDVRSLALDSPLEWCGLDGRVAAHDWVELRHRDRISELAFLTAAPNFPRYPNSFLLYRGDHAPLVSLHEALRCYCYGHPVVSIGGGALFGQEVQTPAQLAALAENPPLTGQIWIGAPIHPNGALGSITPDQLDDFLSSILVTSNAVRVLAAEGSYHGTLSTSANRIIAAERTEPTDADDRDLRRFFVGFPEQSAHPDPDLYVWTADTRHVSPCIGDENAALVDFSVFHEPKVLNPWWIRLASMLMVHH